MSLRARLLLAVGAITLVAFILADPVVYGTLRAYLYNQVDNTLELSHMAVEQTADNPGAAQDGGGIFVPPPLAQGQGRNNPGGTDHGNGGEMPGADRDDGGASAFCALGRESAPGMFIEVISPSGAAVTGAAGLEECPAFQPGRALYSPKLPAKITGFTRSKVNEDEPVTFFTTASTVPGGPTFRVRASKIPNGDVVVLATPISDVTSTLSQLVVAEIVVTAGALVGALVLGLWLVRVGLRPLRDVERTAEAISGGDLMHRVPNPDPRTEVGHLAMAFNVMLGRVEQLVGDLRASQDRLRRFVGDASHELRTPTAAVAAYAELFRRGAASHPEDLERAMQGIERESARMAGLIEDLLTLARLDEQRPLEAERVELVDMVVEACETARLVGPSWPVRYAARDAVEVLGDRGALRQVLDNLLANVRAHTPPGTATTVTVGRDGHQAFIEVADNGPGISQEQAKVIFERFVRLDESRSRESGGAGLGLAIAHSIVKAHGGSVHAAPAPAGGALFRVTLPALDPE
ncbi:MAG TPA: HAMP domain-containing sensor histidine kinase [Acidimicrobiales bacterium]|nr:HAMP domain-containing sensor histidine kinase [Acidimicrobiales bacterium]